MLNRLKWILWSYACRPTVMVLFGLACLLYVGEAYRWPVFESLADAYRAQKASNAATFSVSRGWSAVRISGNFFRILWPCLVVAVAIGTQLSCQFRGPFCRVLPRFEWAHFLIAGVLSTVAIWLGTERMVSAGGPLMPSLAVAMVATACGMTISSRAVLAGSSASQFGFASTIAYTILLSTILCLSLTDLSNPIPPVMILSLLGISAVVIAVGVRALLHLSCVPKERPVFDREGVLQQTWHGMRMNESIFGAGRGEPLLAKLPSPDRKPSFWQRVERWRLGNLPKPNRRLMLAMISILAAGPFLISGSLRPSEFFVRVFLILGAFIVAGVGFGRVATIWRARLLVLSTEIFRPVGKHALQREWMAAVVKDVFPSVLCSTFALALANNLRENFVIDWRGFGQNLLYVFPSMFVWSLGFVGTLIVVQRNWIALLIVVPVIYLQTTFFLFVMGEFLSPEARSFPMTCVFLAILSLPNVFLCGLLARQWFRMEIGARQ